MTRASTQEHRQTNIDGTSNLPGWWTPTRRAVMEALLARSEIRTRMKTRVVGKEPSRWRPHATGMKTKHLFDTTDTVLNSRNVGPAIRNLIDWGYIFKLSTTVSKVMFTPKGWAWLAAEKLIEPAWLELIYERSQTEREIAWGLYRKMRDSRKLAALGQPSQSVVDQATADIMEPTMTDLPFETPTEDELPGLPEFDGEVTDILQRRALNGDEVIRTRLQLARDFHHKTNGALSKMEPREIDKAISRHFSSEEVLRADLELIRDQRKGPRESYYSRELVNRMSEAGEFQPRSLADHLGTGHKKLEGLSRGVDRIAFGLEAQALREEGISRAMPSSTTLGEVHDRLRAESVSAMAEDDLSIPDPNTIMDAGKPYRRDEAIADVISHGEDFRTALTFMRDNAAPATVDSDDPGYWQHQLNVLDRILLALDISSEPVPTTPENIEAASAAAKAEDDALPMVDWIDRQIGQHSYDGWVPDKQAALIARSAVFRHMRENPSGAQIIGEGNITQYDGFRLHVRRNISALDGRHARLALTIDSDYDERDTANVEAWFDRLIEGRGRQYVYPAGANVDHAIAGELEDIKVRSINPIWMVAMMFGSAFLALILFVVLLSVLPIKGA